MIAEATAPPPFLLQAAKLRLCDGTELELPDANVAAQRLALVGDWTAWFDLLAQRAALVQGRAELAGRPLPRALREGVVGLAQCDPPLPAAWTVKSYLVECASLAGRKRREAKRLAEETLAAFELRHLAQRLMSSLRHAERRVACIAGAVITSPQLLCCELPLHRLDGAAQAYAAAALERAANGRALVFSLSRAPELGPERALLDRADSVLMLQRRSLSARSAADLPSRASRLLVSVSSNGDGFARALAARGLRAASAVSPDVFAVFSKDTARFERFEVTGSSERLSEDALAAAFEADAVIVELLAAD